MRDLRAMVVLFALLPFSTLLRAWVITVCWGWFAQPLGAPAVGVWHAFGLTCLWTVLSKASVKINPTDEDKVKKMSSGERSKVMYEASVRTLLFPLFVLASAWVAHWFMVSS